VIREPRIYAWIPGKRPVIINRPKRAPVLCEVCGEEIDRPEVGASKQFVCAGKGNKKSRCQKIRRYAFAHGLPISEAANVSAALNALDNARSSGGSMATNKTWVRPPLRWCR